MISITRMFGFDAAHRVLNHESKCKHLHGHRYTAHVDVTADSLDQLDRIVDFGVVKELVGGWIDEWWDHNTLLNQADPLLQLPNVLEIVGRQPFVLDRNPTAEVLARCLFVTANNILLPHNLKVIKVVLYETPNCYASVS